MDISLFKKAKEEREVISSVEAYNLWNTLRSRYLSIQTYQIFLNYVHDRDFTLILKENLSDFESQLIQLEKLSKKHKIIVPERPPKDIRITQPSDEITDKMIFKHISTDIVYEMMANSRAITSSTTNDSLRRIFINFGFNHINNYNTIFKYGKLKGWAEIAPAFITGLQVEQEPLSVAEANHLWDHINLRYDQMYLTKVFMDFVHDKEFQRILQLGNTELTAQVKMLEEKALQFGIPLPERPPAIQESTIDPEVIEDKYIYRIIFKGIEDAIDLHIRAVIETVKNDFLRDIFYGLLKTEINNFDKLVKYGKTKGWTHILPIYRKG